MVLCVARTFLSACRRNDGTACCRCKNNNISIELKYLRIANTIKISGLNIRHSELLSIEYFDKNHIFAGLKPFQPVSYQASMIWQQHIAPASADDYDYDLPEERIALHPLAKRDESKLLIYNKGIIEETTFRDFINYVPAQSHIVFNNSRVINARLLFRKESGAVIEVLCLEPVNPQGYSASLSSPPGAEWKCMVGNLGKWKSGVIKADFYYEGRKANLYAEKIKKEESTGTCIVRFTWDTVNLSFGDVIRHAGHVPLPPYIARHDEPEDELRYQTVYSKAEGSVAAPTAGLHFTPEMMAGLGKKNIVKTEITLHVGAGTFLPVKSKNIHDHRMHSERFMIDYDGIQRLINHPGKVIAVGTTSLRALESLYIACTGAMKNKTGIPDLPIEIGQWDGYDIKESPAVDEAFNSMAGMMLKRGINELWCSTRLMIVPGFRFRVADILVTNFHLPRSTLLMLVAAWAGDDWKKIYNYALSHDFRFLSYGDSSLLVRNGES